MTKEEYEKMVESDDFELQLVRAHKNGTLPTELNVELCRKNLEESIFMCDTGECLGEGWHGGMTREKWNKRGEYYRKCLRELDGNIDIGIPEVELKIGSNPLVTGYMKYMIGNHRIDRDEYWRLTDDERQALHDKHAPGTKAIPFNPQFAELYGKNPEGPF